MHLPMLRDFSVCVQSRCEVDFFNFLHFFSGLFELLCPLDIPVPQLCHLFGLFPKN